MSFKKAVCGLALLAAGCAHAGLPGLPGLHNSTTLRLLPRDINDNGGIDVLIEELDTNGDGGYDLELHYLVKGLAGRKLKLSKPVFGAVDRDYDGETDELVVRCGHASTRYDLAALESFKRVELYNVLANISYARFCHSTGTQKPVVLDEKIDDRGVSQRWDLDGDGAHDLVTKLVPSEEYGLGAMVCPSSYELYNKRGEVVATFYDEDSDCVVDEIVRSKR